jgi:hypothetical protein
MPRTSPGLQNLHVLQERFIHGNLSISGDFAKENGGSIDGFA